MVKSFTLLGLSCLVFRGVFAQVPANDRPCGALSVTPGVCFDGSTTNSLDDTNGQGIGADCQSHGNNVDVWFTFIADNTGFNFDVYHDTTMSGITYTASSVDVLLFRRSTYSNCDPALPCSDPNGCEVPDLVGLACWEDDGTRVLEGAISSGLVVGQRYYFLVSSAVVSNENPGTFRVCFSNTPYTAPGNGCAEPSTICSKVNFTAAGGDYSILRENLDANSCLGAPYDGTGGYNYNMPSRWYELTFASSGTFGFTLNPNPIGGDLDFAVYNSQMTPCAANMGTPVACNYSACNGVTGISSVLTNDCSGPAINYNSIGDDCNVVTATPNPANCSGTPSLFNAGGGNPALPSGLFNVTAGQTYTIYVGNFANSSANGFSFNFDPNMTALIGPQAGFSVNSITCGDNNTMEVDLSANTITPGFVYQWEMSDGMSYTGTSVLHKFFSTDVQVARLTVQDTNSRQACLASTEMQLSCPLQTVFTSNEAHQVEDGVEIRWTTPVDLPYAYFEVRSSRDLNNWELVGKAEEGVPGNMMRYRFVDPVAVGGSINYRIIHVDPLGMETASTIMNLVAGTPASRNLIRIVDGLGRTLSAPAPAQLHFYIYDDGTTEKRIILK